MQYETILARAFEILDTPPNDFYNPEITQIPLNSILIVQLTDRFSYNRHPGNGIHGSLFYGDYPIGGHVNGRLLLITDMPKDFLDRDINELEHAVGTVEERYKRWKTEQSV